jgi:transglutaminase-like putative cysteine protease
MAIFLTLVTVTLMRFAAYHFLTEFRKSASVLSDVSMRRFLVVGVLVTMLVAAVLFPVLPRVGTPFIVAGAGTGGQRVQSSGFANVMTLDGIGRIRTNEEVALRVRYESPPPAGHEMRFKGATYDLFQGINWLGAELQPERLERGNFNFFHLRRGEPQSWVSIWKEPMGVRNLFLPDEALAIDSDLNSLAIDVGGAVFARQQARTAVEYRVSLGLHDDSTASPPADETPTLDQAGISPAMTAFAAQVMGEGSVKERTKRLEQHLVEEFEYTLELLGRGGDNPIESFLFEDQRGHCEYFASAMVLLLRSQGIPARLITGFLGAEFNAIEDYYVVRQSNAHAWVEAFVPGEGWLVFEPTPPSGRPGSGSASRWNVFRQAYDFVVFRWDRYILSFGASDQVGLFFTLREAWGNMRDLLFGSESDSDAVKAATTGLDTTTQARSEEAEQGMSIARGWWLIPILLALGIALRAWFRRPPFDAQRAYRLLRRQARRRGLDLPDSVPPVELGERLKRTWPETSDAVDPIVQRYLEESFGGRPVDGEEAVALKERLRQAGDAMGKAA